MRRILLLSLIVLSFYSCTKENDAHFTLVNTNHLDHLYQEVTFGSRPAAVIHIYAEYPDYQPVEAAGEGIACIDDIARAAVFYTRRFKYTNQTGSLLKAQRLLNFILGMQAENGFFYNFIDKDFTINKTHMNSEARADWWTWRALWALGEALPLFQESSPEYAGEIENSIVLGLRAAAELGKFYPQKVNFEGFVRPAWLPVQFAADQASVLIKALVPYYLFSSDSAASRIIRLMSEGIVMMQAGDSNTFPYYAFMSWQNMWHAYGNSQSDALLEAGKILSNEQYTKAALKEITHFYPYFMKAGYINYFRIKLTEDTITIADKKQFEQIAYGIRPIVFACLKAHRITDKEIYAQQAAEAASWLLGKNITGKALYNPKTGRCFDGINSKDKINLNSGAESTIEALLALQEIEMNETAKQIVHDYYRNNEYPL
jgi:hypothetical protein